KEAIAIFEHGTAVHVTILAEDNRRRLVLEHELTRAYLENRQIHEEIKLIEHVSTVQKRTLAKDDHFRSAS
ncbi:uncharacterized protein BCR38DRAFT_318489, partial [Pseudomassariella vexata]